VISIDPFGIDVSIGYQVKILFIPLKLNTYSFYGVLFTKSFK